MNIGPVAGRFKQATHNRQTVVRFHPGPPYEVGSLPISRRTDVP
ncbi:hypothetical protein [Escherichia phage UPEC06]|nr:hypothetical protein [Escherichia phage UPEC06]